MPAYLVGVYRHTSREAAERADRMCALKDEAESADTEIHDTPPVVLAGLVRGGEYASNEGWAMAPAKCVCIDTTGRVVSRSLVAFRSAKERGALPITWHVYPDSESQPKCATAWFMLVAECHEPFRAKTTTCAKLNSTTWPAAMREAEGHVAAMRQCYHDVESARVLFVAEEGTLPLDSLTHAPRQEAKIARHALAEALLGIEATTVEEYRDRAHALAMNWKGEV